MNLNLCKLISEFTYKEIMAKDKSLKSVPNLPKKKKLESNAAEVHAENTMDAEVKKKRKKMEVEEAPVEIPPEAITADDKKHKKVKKRKKIQEAETQTKKTEVITLTIQSVLFKIFSLLYYDSFCE
ncbi:hypothetical protein F2P81_022188 [Scophthalmus maximus]|uniref:Uncharacterized protein n=1 Tax=Scophthalmus maximus TaxID=52904 RepID=A0A6A4RXU2_SCOMX|nr:hypothetical protein F2P81_022188 [Scophthalmus maximus]